MKRILGPLRRGVEKYEMIKPGDRIASVCPAVKTVRPCWSP